MSFNQEFIIHPVGQGLFYSGKITHNNIVKFRMVFDCGSLTKQAGQEEVDLYRDADFIEKKILDLLVISHFDSDHINHIGRLLKGDIKVKKLIMPFITFEERLFLVARHLDVNEGYNTDDDFFIRFAIDPIGTLDENLDGSSEILFIDSSPDEPIPTENEGSSASNSSSIDDNNRFNFEFAKSDKEKIDTTTLLLSTSLADVSKISDSKKGRLFTNFSSNKLMEFLFYKRALGKDEAIFFEKVKELFFKQYSINMNLTSSQLLKSIIEIVKTIKSGPLIRKIFEEAKEGLLLAKGIDVVNLNTTALCMMHRNLNGIFSYLNNSIDISRHFYTILNHFEGNGINRIHKFTSDDSYRIETLNKYNSYEFPFKYYEIHSDRFIYPNSLLTSDTFLLKEQDVKEFYNHYKNYWDDYWLFQIPHHGSQNNSNGILHSQISSFSTNFINYGIGNRDNHPNSSVIKSLIITGNSTKLIPINQFQGIRFNLVLHSYQ